MMEEAKLPTYFWVEAVNKACYTQNITLINGHGVTPYQNLKGTNPSLKHLHVFGCKCFVLRTHPKQLGKFEKKVGEGIFVGYPSTKAYKVFNLRTRIVTEFINDSFDDGNISGLDEDSHETLAFRNEGDPDSISKPVPHEANIDENFADNSTQNEEDNATTD